MGFSEGFGEVPEGILEFLRDLGWISGISRSYFEASEGFGGFRGISEGFPAGILGFLRDLVGIWGISRRDFRELQEAFWSFQETWGGSTGDLVGGFGGFLRDFEGHQGGFPEGISEGSGGGFGNFWGIWGISRRHFGVFQGISGGFPAGILVEFQEELWGFPADFRRFQRQLRGIWGIFEAAFWVFFLGIQEFFPEFQGFFPRITGVFSTKFHFFSKSPGIFP